MPEEPRPYTGQNPRYESDPWTVWHDLSNPKITNTKPTKVDPERGAEDALDPDRPQGASTNAVSADIEQINLLESATLDLMKKWIAEEVAGSVDPETLGQLSDIQILETVRDNYEGGLGGFLKEHSTEIAKSTTSGLFKNENN